MPKVRLTNSECRKRGRLPEVCMVCGAPSTRTVNRTFFWVPQWMYFLVGLLILILVFRKSMTLNVPVCPRHRYYWSIKTAIMSVGVVAILTLLFAIPFYYIESARGTPAMNSDFINRDIWLISLGIFLVNGIILTLIVRSGVRPTLIDRDGIEFKCVALEFEQALEEKRQREREDEQADRTAATATARVIRPQPPLRIAKRVTQLPDSAFE